MATQPCNSHLTKSLKSLNWPPSTFRLAQEQVNKLRHGEFCEVVGLGCLETSWFRGAAYTHVTNTARRGAPSFKMSHPGIS